MLYEFNIMSTSLPDIKDPNMITEYMSNTSSLSFVVPSCPENKRLKGINVTFKYAISSEDWAWFCKISTSNGVVDFMYNPKVYGKLEVGEVCIWLSYWPTGNMLDTGDTVNVSIVVLSGLEVHECGASLVYSDQETSENNMEWEEILGGDLSGFELSTGAYYLCRRDLFELMEVGRLSRDWFRILVGDTIDYTSMSLDLLKQFFVFVLKSKLQIKKVSYLFFLCYRGTRMEKDRSTKTCESIIYGIRNG
ncbi:hypothetical protein Hdeb2414_s0017g00505271 [Helianthus debilis subsp. tardiflorus]